MAVRDGFQARIGVPLERMVFGLWKHDFPGSEWAEQLGLPRRVVEQQLDTRLILHVNPRELVRLRDWSELPKRLRPLSSAFIWSGDWDLRREDLRDGSRYRFISDIDAHRDDLTGSEAFRRLKEQVDEGHPWSSHQQGLLLDTEERILIYLRVYLKFMDDMALNGFEQQKGKDRLGVAVSRNGRLIKINRGLHRLAMAQYLGLATVPVEVKAVHRDWWEKVTQKAHGAEAFERMLTALQYCVPETESGPLDTQQSLQKFTWPL
ncbi:hypothetical protein [Halovibrio sp. HP20-59]|uniref:hypothetical protein n=1 Tax=Halovibrio sp. HP20-59 TaxID=3080275 RepID=UPI002AFE18AB|nr:hypothetical protein [Halovibrio sp. HP20-59]MEA2119182.1 hypothetical protein [Halovibrio sp. HP20-59]